MSRFANASRCAVTLATALLLFALPACDEDTEQGQQPDAQIAERDVGEDLPSEQGLTGQDVAEERESVASGAAVAFEASANGHAVYQRNCAVCHGGDGDGNLGPALAGNRNLASSAYTVARIQLGGGGMPPFSRLLSSDEIAAVASFVRTRLGNDLGPVTTQQVDLQWNGYQRGMRYGVYNLPGGG